MKKAFFLISLTVLYFYTSAQIKTSVSAHSDNKAEKVTLKGSLTGAAENSVIKIIALNGSVIDSCFIQHEKFILYKEKEKEAGPLILSITKDSTHEYAEIFIGKENVLVKGNVNDFSQKLKISGSPDQQLKNKLDKLLEDVLAERNRNLSAYILLKQTGKMTDSIWNTYWGQGGSIKMLDEETQYRQRRFIDQNINSYYGLYLLSILKGDYEKAALQKLLAKLKHPFSESKYAKAIITSLKNKGFAIGDKMLNFEALNEYDESIHFADYFTGKNVLLEFSTPYCQFCLKAIEPLKELASGNKNNLTIVTLYVDENKSGYIDFSNHDKKPWGVIWDKKGRFGEAYSLYNIIGTPAFLLFNKEGNLVAKEAGFDESFFKKVALLVNSSK
jgi:thiol-disulfide isomerase/thioredoxin